MVASRGLCFASLSLALATAAIAQADAARMATFARVVDLAGQPVVGAEVTFAGGNPHLVEALMPVDVQVATSDERGRARADLLPGRCYVAWVHGPRDAEGQLPISRAHEPSDFFAAGALVELRCVRLSEPLRRLAITGTEGWQADGPLRYFAMTPHPGLVTELEPDADGLIAKWTVANGAVEIRTADGQPLWSIADGGLEVGHGQPHQHPVDVPPPQQVRVRAVDENGAAIAGATIRHRTSQRATFLRRPFQSASVLQSRLREVGVTDAEGRATVVVPHASDPLREASGRMLLEVSAPGRATVVGGVWGRFVYVNGRRLPSFEGEELPFTLPAVEPVAAVAGLVPPGTRAQLVAACKLYTSPNQWQTDRRLFVTEVGADGRLQFDGVPPDVDSMRICLMPEAGGEPFVCSSLTGRVTPPALLGDSGPWSSRFARLRLQVLDASGGPARGAIACVMALPAATVLQRESVFRFPLDTTGRGGVKVTAGEWVAIVVTPVGYAAALFTAAGGEDVEVGLQLQPLARMKVVLRDRDGAAIVGARVRFARSRATGGPSPLDAALYAFERGVRQSWNQLETDAGGALTIPFLPTERIQNRVKLYWPGGVSVDFTVEVTDEPLELTPK